MYQLSHRIVVLASGVIGVLLIATGIDKAIYYREFVVVLGKYWFIPASWKYVVGVAVILTEIFLGSSLLIRSTRQIASLLAASLLVLFTVGSAVQLYFAPNASCGCWFSVSETKFNLIHLLLNLILIFTLFIVHIHHKNNLYEGKFV